MNVEEVITFIDTSMYAKKGKYLSTLQKKIIQEIWPGRQSYKQIATKHQYCPSYLSQDVGPKLWRQLSEVFGERITKAHFRAIIERLVV